MVTRDHYRTDSGKFGCTDCLRSFFPRWIDHCHQPDKCKSIFLVQRQFFTLIHFFIRKREHTEAIFRKFLILSQDFFLYLVIDFTTPPTLCQFHTPIQQNIDSTFGKYRRYTMQTVFGTHQFTFRVKGNFFQSWHHFSDVVFRNSRLCQPCFLCHRQKTTLRRIPDFLAFLKGGIVIQDCIV